MNTSGDLVRAISSLNEKEVDTLVAQMISTEVPALDILAQCHKGMAEVGERFAKGECFIPELMLAGKIMETVMGDLEPLLKGSAEKRETLGTVVMGTVQNDIHNIGKDIVVMMLRGAGFDVIDLGVSVSPEKYVQAIRDHDPMAIGMSVLLTTCYKAIPVTVDAIKQAGLRDKVSIMLGGAAASQMLAEKTGCDFYGQTAVDAVTHSTELVQSRVSA